MPPTPPPPSPTFVQLFCRFSSPKFRTKNLPPIIRNTKKWDLFLPLLNALHITIHNDSKLFKKSIFNLQKCSQLCIATVYPSHMGCHMTILQCNSGNKQTYLPRLSTNDLKYLEYFLCGGTGRRGSNWQSDCSHYWFLIMSPDDRPNRSSI